MEIFQLIKDIITIGTTVYRGAKFLFKTGFPWMARSARELLTKMRPPVIEHLSVHVGDAMVFADSVQAQVKAAQHPEWGTGTYFHCPS